MKVKKSVQIVFKYIFSFFLVVLISFFLPRLIPGNPLYALAGEGSGYSTCLLYTSH